MTLSVGAGIENRWLDGWTSNHVPQTFFAMVLLKSQSVVTGKFVVVPANYQQGSVLEMLKPKWYDMIQIIVFF